MFNQNNQTLFLLLVHRFHSVLSILAFAAIVANLKINTAEAALVPIARDTQVYTSSTFCSLSCYMDGETPTRLSFIDTFNNANSDPLVNIYENPYQTSFFSPTQIYALTSGSAYPGGTGEFGSETYSSSFSLQFSLASPHNFELSGLMKALWGGYSLETVMVRLAGPLIKEFSIPFEFGYFDIQSPISISGILPVGTYTFEVAIGGSGSSIELSNLSAEATLNIRPVPVPTMLPLFLSAVGVLSLMGWRDSIRKKQC